MVNHYGYRKVVAARVVRTSHSVGFPTGITAKSLIEMLSSVPGDAHVGDVVRDESAYPMHTTIEFHEEKVDRDA